MSSALFSLPIQLPNELRSLLVFRSNQDIVNQAVIEITDRMLYDVEKNRTPIQNGALDGRLVGFSGYASVRTEADAQNH